MEGLKYQIALNYVLDAEDYYTACDMVYMWVKEGQISDTDMADLIIAAYKKFIY